MLKKAIQRGRREDEYRSVPSEVREDFGRARTKLEAFFSILLNRILKRGFRANRARQHAFSFQFLDDLTGGGIVVFGT
jgi:hypothetical protein